MCCPQDQTSRLNQDQEIHLYLKEPVKLGFVKFVRLILILNPKASAFSLNAFFLNELKLLRTT